MTPDEGRMWIEFGKARSGLREWAAIVKRQGREIVRLQLRVADLEKHTGIPRKPHEA